MSFNGSGTFSLVAGVNPVVTGTIISSTWANSTLTDIATGLSTAICKDGQQTVTANIPFAGFKLTGVGAATLRTDATNLGNIQDGTGVYVATVGGTADAITLTPSPAITSYSAGQSFKFIAGGNNTTAVTVAISGLAAKAVKKEGGDALVAGNIQEDSMVEITYDGTNFEITSFTPSIVPVDPSQITSSLIADVNLNNTGTYFDGPTVAQGSVGTWFVSGTVCAKDATQNAGIDCKLWDGTTVIASCRQVTQGAGNTASASLSGYITSPAGNLRISVKDATTTGGTLLFNASGLSMDCTITAYRIE